MWGEKLFSLLCLIKQQERYKNHLKLRLHVYVLLSALWLVAFLPVWISFLTFVKSHHYSVSSSFYSGASITGITTIIYTIRGGESPHLHIRGWAWDWQQKWAWGTLVVQGAAGVDEIHPVLHLCPLTAPPLKKKMATSSPPQWNTPVIKQTTVWPNMAEFIH